MTNSICCILFISEQFKPEGFDPNLEEEFNQYFHNALLENAKNKESLADNYSFQPENKYEGKDGLLELATNLFNKGQNYEAILAAEQHVKEHADSSEGWRLLGEIHATNDDDDKAIGCLYVA
jgi:Flp pilus assembly protein TadD